MRMFIRYSNLVRRFFSLRSLRKSRFDAITAEHATLVQLLGPTKLTRCQKADQDFRL